MYRVDAWKDREIEIEGSDWVNTWLSLCHETSGIGLPDRIRHWMEVLCPSMSN